MRKVDWPEGFKRCSICKEILPLSEEYFGRSKRIKDGFRGQCKECRRLKEYEANKGRILKRRKRHYEENKDNVLKKTKEYKAENKEWYQGYYRRYYLQNQEKLKDRSNAYYHKNKEKLKLKRSEYSKKWWSSEKGQLKRKIYKHRRKSMKEELPNALTSKQWRQSLKHFNNTCAYCGREPDEIQQDHVIPLSKGGGYIKQNIVPACPSCNYSKNANEMETWYKQQDFFSQKRFDKIRSWMGVDIKNNTQQLSIL